MKTRVERLEFVGALGTKLVGRLEQPSDQTPLGYALFAHCFTCGKDLKGPRQISRALARQGIAVFRFDFTGLGESEGDFAETNFSSNLGDLLAAAAFLRQSYQAPALLVGHSLGGVAMLAVAAQIPECKAVATIAAPSGAEHLIQILHREAPLVVSEGEQTVEIGGRRFQIKKQLLEDLETVRLDEAIANLGRPLVVFHSPADEIVSIENARRIFERAQHPKSFISLDRANHLLSRAADAEFVACALAAWARRYVTDHTPKPIETVEHGTVVVHGSDSLAQDVVMGPHQLVADEPLGLGGQDSGPSPYDLLLAALGACTSMTLRLYADRKKWPLTTVTVRLRHERVHAKDCADCESETGFVDRISREIELRGPLDDDMRQRLVDIANKCPVHRTLLNETKVDTRLVP